MASKTVHTGTYSCYLRIDYTFTVSGRTWTLDGALIFNTGTATMGPWANGRGNYLTTDSSCPIDNYTALASTAAGKDVTIISSKRLASGTYDNAGTAPSVTVYWKWGVNSSWGGMAIPSGSTVLTGSSIGAAFTNPSWTKYTINSFPTTAYANMPYTYNIDLACSYGSSTSQNLLYWESTSGITTVSTTSTAIGAGARTYTFGNSNIGTHTFRGVIRYYNGGTLYNVNGTTRNVTVSFLNPTLTGVSNTLNSTNFYRSSTVSSTVSATVTGNSTSPYVYTYFSSPDAPGDGSGTGFYQIAGYGAASANAFNGITKSYTHPGNKPGTFYARLSLRGNNGSGTWTEFATAGQVSYTMHEFVAPTATRTVTYNRNNVYVGQTKFPVTVTVTGTSKSQYDNLTPTFSLGTCKNGNWSYDTGALGTHSFANGTYNITLTKTSDPYSVGDTASFRDEMVYKDALNENAYTSVSSQNYVVKTIPQPNAAEMLINVSNNEIKKEITAGIATDFDSDFVGQYTLYLENASGTTIYAQTSGSIGAGGYTEHTFTYNSSVSENYKVRMVANFAIDGEPTVKGSSFTSYSNTVRVIGGTKIYIKFNGENYDKLLPIDDDDCPKPRLAIKYGDTIKYVPLYTDTPPAGVRKLWVKKGTTSYYTLLNTQFGSLYPSDDLYPEGNELSYDDISVYTHEFLSSYTHQEIHDGDIG